MESLVSVINGREYVACLSSAGKIMIQDFIRFPIVVPLETPKDVCVDMVDVIMRNSKLPSASSMSIGGFSRSTITGEDNFPVVTGDSDTAIGVHRAIFSELVSHAILRDPDGSTLPFIREHQGELPIGLFHIETNPSVARAWKTRGSAGVFRSPSGHADFTRSISHGNAVELYCDDDAATAVHFSISFLKSNEITLHECDVSYADQRDGMVPFNDRWIWPGQEAQLQYLHTICHIAIRNDIRIMYTKGTMASIPGAVAIDKHSLEAQT